MLTRGMTRWATGAALALALLSPLAASAPSGPYTYQFSLIGPFPLQQQVGVILQSVEPSNNEDPRTSGGQTDRYRFRAWLDVQPCEYFGIGMHIFKSQVSPLKDCTYAYNVNKTVTIKTYNTLYRAKEELNMYLPLDLNGLWTVNGVAVGVKHSSASVTATFLATPGCSITQFFSASLSGVAPGSQMSGTINVCRGQSPQGCPSPPSPTFSAQMQATAQQNTINIDYEPENIVVTKRRFTGTVLSCTTSPSGSMRSHFILTRCAPSSSNCGCQQGSINILTRIRDGKKTTRQAYEDVKARGTARTFEQIQAQVLDKVNAKADEQGTPEFTETGAPDLKYHGCAEDAPVSRCTSLEVVPKCKPSPSGIQSIYDMCVQHERGHAQDLQRAFWLLKSGEWDEARYDNYVGGKSTIREDVTRLTDDEIERYRNDINFLDNEISKLEQQHKQNCP